MEGIVERNLLAIKDYTPYCGSNIPRPPVGKGCSNPRTVWNPQLEQFVCPSPNCKWVSSFSKEFIKTYKEKWGL